MIFDSDEEDFEGAKPKMLPPAKFTLAAHKLAVMAKGAGRKRRKRFRSSGAVGDKGGARKRKPRKGSGRPGGRNDGSAAQAAIASADFGDLL